MAKDRNQRRDSPPPPPNPLGESRLSVGGDCNPNSPALDVCAIGMTLTFVLYCIVQPQQGPALAYVSNLECFPGVYGRHGVYLELHAPVAPLSPVADGRRGGGPEFSQPKPTSSPKYRPAGGPRPAHGVGGPCASRGTPIGMFQVVLQPGMEFPSSE